MDATTRSLHLAYQLVPESENFLRVWDETVSVEPPLQPIRWHVYFERYLRSATVSASTQIEGNPLQLEDVDALLQGEHVDGASPHAQREVLNYNNALSTATSLALSPTFDWSESILRLLNHEVLRDLPDDDHGQYRREPVTVNRRFSPPNHLALDGLMASLVDWLRTSQDHPLVRVALLHLNIVAIHPWADGNGRTARIASSLELMRCRVGAPELIAVEPYLRSHQNEYFDCLAQTLGESYSPERHTASEWVNYYIRISAQRLSFRERMRDAWPYDVGTIAEALSAAGHPAAWGPILLTAASVPVRTRWVSSLIDRGMVTARNTLSRMEREGWLEGHGQTRGRHYIAGNRLRALGLRSPEIIDLYVRGQTLGLEAA